MISLGAIAGLGLLGLFASLRSRRQALTVSLRALDGDPVVERERGPARSLTPRHLVAFEPLEHSMARLRSWLGATLEATSRRTPSIDKRLRSDLACTGSSIDSLAEQCALAALAGALLPFVAWALLLLRGVEVALTLPVWVALVGAIIGAALPVLHLGSRATKERRHARRMVGCFLDLVVLALAGGLGIEGALHAAAAISDSRVSLRLVRALDVARDSGRTPWEALAGLGRDLGVVELVELASAVSLAGTEGARIKSTLAAKAASIRRHELADAETDANTITERLFLPGVLLLVGFLIFIGYPAVARLTAGL